MQKNKKLKLLFLNILTDNLKLKKETEERVIKGSYLELFRKKLGLKKDEFIGIYAPKEKLPNPIEFQGIIIGGSLHNPIKGEEKPWMKKVYIYIKKAINQRVPLLGVCGGHQFIARALGEKVIYNPKGREFGTIQLTLTEEGKKDPLFKGIPKIFFAQLSHQCMVEKVNPKWKLLACSDFCKIQALAINDQTRSVQFHPEFSVNNMKSLARVRKKLLEKEKKGFITRIKDARESTKVLRNFIKYFVLSSN
ncbi:MAG: type 1 glutamine amidotransferase [Patescibacteria group bacterium]|nr:type 1 glutamine amidotransferase [Patescibacteria group bacterium]